MVSRIRDASAVLNAVIFAALIMENIIARFVPPKKHKILMNDRDEYFMRLAIDEAEEAFSAGEVPVGALLVKEDDVIFSAHNSKESTSDPTAHAELIVIREGAMKAGEWRLMDYTLYVTKEPCVMCAGAMINARLGRLVYGCKDDRYGAVISRYQIVHDPFFNHGIKVISGVMEHECANILKKFFKTRR